jgi:hypothetical protein
MIGDMLKPVMGRVFSCTGENKMSGYFWEGFEKRAAVNVKGVLEKGKQFLGGLSQHLPPNLQQGAQSIGQKATELGSAAWGDVQKGLHKSLSDHAERLGGKAGETIIGHLEHIAKNLNPDAGMDALKNLARSVGIAKKPKGLLERAGDVVKKHPVAATGLGVAGLGGAGYAMSRPSKPQQPMGGQDYQYYNPYV